MPQITSIEPQKKKKNRFNIFIDGNFSFGADEITIANNHLSIGLKLTNDQIEKIIKETIFAKLLDAGLRFLSLRPRSEKEVVDYLARKISAKENVKFNDALNSPLIDKVLVRLKKYKYINDREFAKWWLTSRVHEKKGPKAVKYELFKKGIDKETIELTINNFPNQKALAAKAIEKKLARWQKLPNFELKKKVYQFLGSRGFDFDVINEIFAQLVKKG